MSFLAGIYLWFLPFTLLPIIFHFLKKRNYKDIKFSTTRFLLDMREDSIKKINLINILLLIIRTLIILFLILMISKPVYSTYNRSFTEPEDTMFLVLVDDSYSNFTFLNNNFVNIINKVKKNYSPNSYFEVKGLSGAQYSPLQKIKDYNSNSRYTFKKYGNYQLDKKHFLQNKNVESFLNKDLYLFSDLHSSLIQFNSQIDTYDWNIFIYEHDIINHPIVLSNISSNDNIFTNNSLVSFFIDCQNISRSDLFNVEVELFLNNIKVSDSSVNLKSNESKKIEFQTSFSDKGIYNCFFKVNDYKYYFNIEVDTEKNIALIYENFDDIKFVKSALSAYNNIYDNLIIDEFINDEFLNINKKYESIVLFDSPYLNTNLVSNIFNKTSNLILVPSEQLDVSKFQFLFKDINLNDFDNNSKSGNFVLNKKFRKNIYLDNIFKSQNTNISINRYFNILPSENTVLFIDSEKAFLNKYESNSKNLFILSVPLNIDSSTLPLSGTFIPFLNYLLKLNDTKYYHYIDDELYIEDYIKENIIIHNVNGNNFEYPNGFFKKHSFNLLEPGFHKLNVNGIMISNTAANINPDEILNSKIDMNVLNTKLNNPVIINSTDLIESKLNDIISGINLWYYLLYIILILLIVEMYISNIYLYRKND